VLWLIPLCVLYCNAHVVYRQTQDTGIFIYKGLKTSVFLNFCKNKGARWRFWWTEICSTLFMALQSCVWRYCLFVFVFVVKRAKNILTIQCAVVTVCTARFSISVLPTQSARVFCVDLRTNSDYFTVRLWLTGFYNGDGMCLLRGTSWIVGYIYD